MSEATGQTERLSAPQRAEYEPLRARVNLLVGDALALLPQVEGLPPQRLAELRDARFHTDHPFLLVFAGPFSAGKSSLINALLLHDAAADDEPIDDAADAGPLPVGPIPTTERIAILRWGARYERRSEGDSLDGVYFPAPALRRVSFVDTPGLGSVFSEQDQLTRRFLHRSDAVFWVMLARQALIAEHLDALRALREFGKKTILLLNQADTLAAADRQTVLEFVREQSQARLGWQPPVWLVSAKDGLAVGAGGENTDARWRDSGLALIGDFIAEQLGDRARLRQKLSTPLRIIQRAVSEAQAAITQHQARHDELGRAVANWEGQIAAARGPAQLALAGARQSVITSARAVQHSVAAGWRAAFPWRKLPQLLARGLLETLGLGWLMRRGDREALLPAGMLAAAEQWPAAAEQLAGRMEARDWQDLGDLVAAAQAEAARLPEETRARLVGSVAMPGRYDRRALEETRQSLRELSEEKRRRESERMAEQAQRLLAGVSLLQILLLMLALGALLGRPLLANWRPEAPLYALVALVALFMASALSLPLSARWQAARFARRWRNAQEDALRLLDEGAARQQEYGLQLRRDAILPITRLREASVARQDEQSAALQRILSQIDALAGQIREFGRPNWRERLGLPGAVPAASDEVDAVDDGAPAEVESLPPARAARHD